jgi:hypothetical protein
MTQNSNFIVVLAENDLDEYISIFKENHLTDMNIIVELTESDLEKLGIKIMGYKIKIINNIKYMKRDNESIMINEKSEYLKSIIPALEQPKYAVNKKRENEITWPCPKCNNLNQNDIYQYVHCGYRLI